MRTLSTRRGLIFLFSFVVLFSLFTHFGLDSMDVARSSSLGWISWFNARWARGIGDGSGLTVGVKQGDSMLKTGHESQKHAFDLNRDAGASSVCPDGKFPPTEVRMHVPGWTIFERLYLFNGTIFIVTDSPKEIPDRMLLTSSGYPIFNQPEDVAKRTPTDADMQIISCQRATELFESAASRVEGTSFVVNDPPQFVKHYYHWSAELFFGLWMAYSTLDPKITPDGGTKLPPPRRIIMSHVPYAKWRDYAAMNQWVTRGAFPSVSLEFQEDWADRAAMARPFLLDRVVFADRAAAMHGPDVDRTGRAAAELFKLVGSPYWWSTIRNTLIEFSGGGRLEQDGKVITYVSRQEWGRRMLLPEHHDRLVKALEELRDHYGYEVNVVSMEKHSRAEQFRLASRTTILMGVHGNGLTALLWMQPSRGATVMEFFYPGGFTYDYEWITRALGMKHYGFWGHEHFTSPDLPPRKYPEGFQGSAIPIDGDVVARLCHERLSLMD